jgi:hypothetical protein
MLMSGQDGVDEALADLQEADLAGLRSAGVLRIAKAIYLRAEVVTPAALVAEAAGDEDRRMLTEVAVEGAPATGVRPVDCVKELKRVPLKARMAEIQRGLAAASGQALEALLQEKLQIGRRMANL